MFMCPEEIGISQMVGLTFVSVTGNVGDGKMVFVCEDGTKFIFYHDQDCCESVEIEDIVGDLSDLVGQPIVQADEEGNGGFCGKGDDNHETWTFYKFATVNGSVTVRWYGTSNGYYSESVDLRVERPNDR